jgi:hypothetical protein
MCQNLPSSSLGTPQPNNGMHPTADTLLVTNLYGARRRVMPGVSWLRQREVKML